ncbi:MAG: O-antigen ligase family protein [Algoriphagus aquaeductus]|uniref:O-antigen ligase family protein n=1 Tax=Algoriphagus aquaeductus TaxID=475299 RepID=UPI00391ADBCF
MRIFLSDLKKYNYSFFWFLVHVLVGISATISTLPVIVFFYSTIIYTIINLLYVASKERARLIGEIIIYFASFEAIGRLAQADPFLPYELGKYLILFLCPLGILIGRGFSIKGSLGLIILILALPAAFFDESGIVSYNDVKFNILGLLNIGMAIWFYSSLKISLKTLVSWSKLMLYPIVSVLVFTIIRTPDLDTVEFTLGANFATAGGFGSNQVSTILGLGVFLLAACILLNYRITGYKWLDLVVLALLTVQGLLTFSRGGMIGGFFGILVLMFHLTKLSVKERKRLSIPNFKKYVLPVGILLVIVMAVANSITGGMLLLRYMGETQGTLAGSAEKSLNKITTNRSDIFLEDVELFSEYPIMGVGVGASTYLRDDYKGYAPHVELSRLLAEHGLLGVIIFLLFLVVFVLNKNGAPENISKGILMACFFIGFLATFHSATRTYITPLLMGISCVGILIPKRKVSIGGDNNTTPKVDSIINSKPEILA